jgi:hyaluronan synthase
VITNAALYNNNHRVKRRRSDRRGICTASSIRLEKREAIAGALNAEYFVPRVRYKQSPPIVEVLALLIICFIVARHIVLGNEPYVLIPFWAIGFFMRVMPLVVSWFDRPFETTESQDEFLRTLNVAVIIPLFNEAIEFIDRTLWALVNQSRPPQMIVVVDDGSTTDYSSISTYWQMMGVTWITKKENDGKKYTQAIGFKACPDSVDIFVTTDSDTAIEYRGLENGLKPLADSTITSVAGIEENYNKSVNWLTRSVAARNTYYQLTCWATQSVFSSLLVNRGTFAIYRAWIVREALPCYVGETFFGMRIKLGDDAALTLFSQHYGRTVQQLTAYSLPEHPEHLSHHFRQWIRWARGAVIRNCWRLRYLPVSSYGFWWTVAIWYGILMSFGVPVLIALTWPKSESILLYAGLIIVVWTYGVSFRILSVKRGEESNWSRALSLLLYPAGILWATTILRVFRLYGVITFRKQRWTTRQHGIEDLEV